VAQVAQKAMNIGFDGLMIETHINPSLALTDASQQLTPQELQGLLDALIIRKGIASDADGLLELEYLRQTADNIDAEIIDLLSKRMEISALMGDIKRQNNITAYQPDRWREILDTRCEQGYKVSLDKQYIASLWQIIHDESIKKQLEIPVSNPQQP
jgi:chorismate mutase